MTAVEGQQEQQQQRVEETPETGVVDFASFELDPRINRVLERGNICKPTLIQEKAIPLALVGKDLLVKARTGSGKTLAYLLPILQSLLAVSRPETIRALLLVPTKELARQVSETITGLLHYFPREVSSLNLAGEESSQLQKSMLVSRPTLLVATPSRILPHLDAKTVDLAALEYLVIDEADLVLSFGYAADVERLAREFIPKTVQTFLMSATLSPEVESLKQLVLRNPVILKLEDAEDDPGQLQQFIMRCNNDDKFLLLYVALKLRLLRGKLLIFANSVERCFQLKLFLEQFGIRACLLNPELPTASRHHIVEEFNRSIYDVVIASDVQAVAASDAKAKGSTDVAADDAKKPHGKKRASWGGGKADREGGVARGVDFKRVDVVINFDLPQHVDSYVHRIGRTARGGHSGMALSLVSSNDDERILAAITADQQARGNVILPHDFDMGQLDGFRYRCGDALRMVNRKTVRRARLRAVKEELLKSEKLRSFFAERPQDLDLLRHDKASGVMALRAHLRHIPEYLLVTREHGPEAGEGETAGSLKLDPLLPQQGDENGNYQQPQRQRKSQPASKRGGPKRRGHYRGNPLKRMKRGK